MTTEPARHAESARPLGPLVSFAQGFLLAVILVGRREYPDALHGALVLAGVILNVWVLVRSRRSPAAHIDGTHPAACGPRCRSQHTDDHSKCPALIDGSPSPEET